ncbi:MAG: hypothetical protein LBL35_04615 [Clostridiales bacterium]|jgi:cysteinyl-tRNA synthetase|nr:hypothetical protein [Clostridiales bacterium]
MSVFNVFLLASIVTGIALMAFSLFMYMTDYKRQRAFSAENAIKSMELSVKRINAAIESFGAASRVVFKQLEETNTNMEKLRSFTAVEPERQSAPKNQRVHENRRDSESLYAPPIADIYEYAGETERARAKDVFSLNDKGVSAQDIARKLGIGQGEVRLMLDMGK